MPGGDFEGSISASKVTQDSTHSFVTDAEKTAWNQVCSQSSGSPLHDLLVAAGAVWDDSTKSWTVGTYTGLDNETMAAVYAQTNNALCSDRWNASLQKRMVPVNLPPKIMANLMEDTITITSATEAFRESDFEEINLVPPGSQEIVRISGETIGLFHHCRKLRKINGKILPNLTTLASLQAWFIQCYELREVDIVNLDRSVNFSACSKITRDTMYNIINQAATGYGITITVHADVYAKLTDSANTAWYAINTLAISKKISFASA